MPGKNEPALCLCLAAGLLALSPGAASASIHDVDGNVYGIYEWKVTFTRKLSGRYTTLRLTLPTVSYYGQHNTWELMEATLSVTLANGQPMQFLDYPYNQGDINSGHWIQPLNPNPGTITTYKITATIKSFASVHAPGLSRDLPLYLPGTVEYLAETYPSVPGSNPPVAGVINFDSLIDTFLDDALNNPAWQAGAQPGFRGHVERIALGVSGIAYGSGTILNKPRLLASSIILLGYGDCDELVNLTCALQRRHGIPSRCVLVGSVAGVVPGTPIGSTYAMHAIGEYWNGDGWETYEPHAFTNLAATNQVWLGADQDFANLYFVNDLAVGDTLQSVNYSASSTVFQAGTFNSHGTRLSAEPRELWSQFANALQPPHVDSPSDSIGPPIESVGVSRFDGERTPRRFHLWTARQPMSGTVVLAIELPSASFVEVDLFDVEGRRIEVLVKDRLPAGVHEIRHSQADLGPGVYYARATALGQQSSVKVVFLGR